MPHSEGANAVQSHNYCPAFTHTHTHTNTHIRTPLGMVVKGQIYFLKDFMIGGESHTHVGRLQDDGREGTHTHTHTLTQIYVHTNTHRALQM